VRCPPATDHGADRDTSSATKRTDSPPPAPRDEGGRGALPYPLCFVQAQKRRIISLPQVISSVPSSAITSTTALIAQLTTSHRRLP
jgi:hypothetical protein